MLPPMKRIGLVLLLLVGCKPATMEDRANSVAIEVLTKARPGAKDVALIAPRRGLDKDGTLYVCATMSAANLPPMDVSVDVFMRAETTGLDALDRAQGRDGFCGEANWQRYLNMSLPQRDWVLERLR